MDSRRQLKWDGSRCPRRGDGQEPKGQWFGVPESFVMTARIFWGMLESAACASVEMCPNMTAFGNNEAGPLLYQWRMNECLNFLRRESGKNVDRGIYSPRTSTNYLCDLEQRMLPILTLKVWPEPHRVSYEFKWWHFNGHTNIMWWINIISPMWIWYM